MDAFFSDKSTTQAECDRFAEALCGGPVEPVAVQGGHSYTVVKGGEVVQFREKGSTLPDPENPLFLVFTAANPGFVADHIGCGTIGTLQVYRMPKLEGVSFPLALQCYADRPKRRMELAGDLAGYVAAHESGPPPHGFLSRR